MASTKALRDKWRREGRCPQCGGQIAEEQKQQGLITCEACLDKMRLACRRYRANKKDKEAEALATKGVIKCPVKVKLPPGPYFVRATNPVMGHLRWGRLKTYFAKRMVRSRGLDPMAYRVLAIMAAVERGLDPDEAVR